MLPPQNSFGPSKITLAPHCPHSVSTPPTTAGNISSYSSATATAVDYLKQCYSH